MLNLQKLQLDFCPEKLDRSKYSHIDLEALKESGRVNSIAIDQAVENAKPGNTLELLDDIIRAAIYDRSCTPAFFKYRGYPKSSCLSVNGCAVHGVPNDYVLQEGDILKIDVGTIYKNWYTDAARTVVIGEYKNSHHKLLVESTHDCLKLIGTYLKNRMSLLEVTSLIHSFGVAHGIKLIPELGGHGINKGVLHQEPFISNVVPANKDEQDQMSDYRFKTGDLICIEPVACLKDPKGYIASDGWSYILNDPTDVAAHFEATFLIQEVGCFVVSS